MKYWEFLIQKEGDEAWLPLETQQVEILEGRYRVVAHSDRVNTPMNIRVSQLMTQEMPPRKRVRKRRGETNDAGLVVVMPYVHLKPGQWELTCSSLDTADSSADESWEYQVQLQVFAPTEEDWSSEWPVPTDAATVQSTLVENAEPLASTATQDAAPLVQAQAQLQDNLQRQGQWSEADSAPIDLAYSISLQQQAFLARRNQSMTITGQVQALVDAPQIKGASQLWLRLQNPETAQVIMEAHRPLSLDRLPADFKVKIQLPSNVKTRVVLGEVSLRSASLDGSEPARILSSTAFTITAGIALLLDDIANKDLGEFEEEEEPLMTIGGPSASGASASGASVNGNEPNLVSPLLAPTYKDAVPAVGVVLPPRLDHNGYMPVEPGYPAEQPELPSFPPDSAPSVATPSVAAQPLSVSDAPVENATSPSASEQRLEPTAPDYGSRPPMVAQPAQFMGTSIEDDDLEASQIAALLEDIDGNLASQEPSVDELEPPGIEGSLPESQTPHQRSASRTLSQTSSDDSRQRSQGTFKEEDKEDSQSPFKEASRAEKAASAPSSRTPSPRTPSAPPRKEQFLTRAERARQERQQRQAEANVAFKSLKLKDHFWQRLSNLTHESHEEATQLAQNMKDAGVTPGSQKFAPFRSTNAGQAVNRPVSNSEVVIFDEPAAIEPTATKPAMTSPTGTGPAVTEPASTDNVPVHTEGQRQDYGQNYGQNYGQKDSVVPSLTVPSASSVSSTFTQQPPLTEDMPEMALPVISVPAGDLIAGDTVTITVRSQPSVYKPFIKLWMVDRQSRTLVGEPKLLTNLKPDALGYLETSADLRVPMGCLDVQIAAIAVDMATQQESNKAIVNRHVVPSRQFPSSSGNFSL